MSDAVAVCVADAVRDVVVFVVADVARVAVVAGPRAGVAVARVAAVDVDEVVVVVVVAKEKRPSVLLGPVALPGPPATKQSQFEAGLPTGFGSLKFGVFSGLEESPHKKA